MNIGFRDKVKASVIIIMQKVMLKRWMKTIDGLIKSSRQQHDALENINQALQQLLCQ